MKRKCRSWILSDSLKTQGSIPPEEEQKRLREALEESPTRKNEPEKQVTFLTRSEVAKMLQVCPKIIE